MRRLSIAIAGLGNVGREAARLFLAHKADFSRRLGADLALSWVCDRGVAAEARRLRLPSSTRRTRDFADVLSDPGVDVVVELFGGLEKARAVVLGSLSAGKHVVTANKLLLAERWNEVWDASRRARRRVYFEAAVAGGIPIIAAIRQGLAANRIASVVGILNGTTNYILSKMFHEGCEMADALKEAQRLGMAEKDPTLDLNGTDTAHKVSILASLLTGSWLDPRRIPRQGIERLEAEDIRFAADKLGRTVRLLGSVGVDWGGRSPALEAHVQPTLIPVKHPLAAVHGGYNAVLVHASSAGDLMFYGKGAGPGPAASAVLGDLLMLCQEILADSGGHGAPDSSRPIRPAPESDSPFYLKLRVRDVPGALSKITGILGRRGISIASIHQDVDSGKLQNAVSVMIVTHSTGRRRMDQALRGVRGLSMVQRGHTCLRILP